MHEFFDDIVPHPDGVDPDHDLIHERAYVVRAYRKDAKTLWLRGAVRDQKPPGLYVPNDPEPLTVHHMIVDLHIAVPSLEIVWANAALETHPHGNCTQDRGPLPEPGRPLHRPRLHPQGARAVRWPTGCTHTTALLQAMAPVACSRCGRSGWWPRAERRHGGPDFSTPEARMRAMAMNLNTCHIWAEDGEQVPASATASRWRFPCGS
jgi:hypothetical protein